MIISLKQNQNFKFKPRIKLNHNIFTTQRICFQEVDNCSTMCGTIEMYNVVVTFIQSDLNTIPYILSLNIQMFSGRNWKQELPVNRNNAKTGVQYSKI